MKGFAVYKPKEVKSMRVILDISDSLFSDNHKDLEMLVSYGEVRRSLRECVNTSSDVLSKEQIKEALVTRLTQLLHVEIENYVNSKIS